MEMVAGLAFGHLKESSRPGGLYFSTVARNMSPFASAKGVVV
ncbi:MAG: hypothetical protein ACI9S8_001483 [Chlamydiales bacterium]|jgi:hypothetical protein